eukprot:ANDGO_03341.mRNA.1 hypothetical protein NAEGRDRAFT_78106
MVKWMRCFTLVFLACVILGLTKAASAVYQEDAGNIDRLQSYIGRPVFVESDSTLGYAYTVTDQGAIAALKTATGELLWRTILPRNENPRMLVVDASSRLVVVSDTSYFTGSTVWVRKLDPANGAFLSEKSFDGTFLDADISSGNVRLLMSLGDSVFAFEEVRSPQWKFASAVVLSKSLNGRFLTGQSRAAIEMVENRKVMVLDFASDTMIPSDSTSAYGAGVLPVLGRHLLYLSSASQVNVKNLVSGGDVTPVLPMCVSDISVLVESFPFVLIRCAGTSNENLAFVLKFDDSKLDVVESFSAPGNIAYGAVEGGLVVHAQAELKVYGFGDTQTLSFPVEEPLVRLFPSVRSTSDKRRLHAILLVSQDASISYVSRTSSAFIRSWKRFEGLPYTRAQTVIPMSSGLRGLVESLNVSRWKSVFSSVSESLDNAVFVGLTSQGLLYGLHHGNPIFQIFVPRFSTVPTNAVDYDVWLLSDRPRSRLHVALSTDTFSMLASFDAQTLRLLESKSFSAQPLLHAMLSDKGDFIAIDRNRHVRAVSSATESAKRPFYVVSPSTAEVLGFETGNPQPVWSVPFFGETLEAYAVRGSDSLHSSDREIVSDSAFDLAGDNTSFSASRVPKVLVPNLLVFVTSSVVQRRTGEQSVCSIYYIDADSGMLRDGVTLSNAVGPVRMAVSEEVTVVFYTNSKTLQQEVFVSRLFYDSPDSRPQLRRDARAFLFPFHVEAVGVSKTQHGVTVKDFLVLTSKGQLVEVSRRNLLSFKVLEDRGSVVPVRHQDIVSYSNKINRPKFVLAEGTRLESTSVVFCGGLDFYMTLVQPNKGFDQLGEGFSKSLLALSLCIMGAVNVVLKKLSSRRRVQKEWK